MFDYTVIITIECPICKKQHEVEVNEMAFYNWQMGVGTVQSLMPELSPTEREQLISHICPSCQKTIFGSDDDDDYDEAGDDINACMRDSLEFTGQGW